MSKFTLCLSVASVFAACALTGCETGDRGGRIDPYSTTSADLNSSGAPVAVLLEFCDKSAMRMAQEISDIPDIKNSPTRVVLELAPISNKTTSSTTDFEQVRARLRSQMINSKVITNNMKIVEQLGRMDAEFAGTQRPAAPNLLQEPGAGGGPAAPATYDPKIVYMLQGDFFETNRGGRRQYLLEFKLTNLGSREIVWSHSFDSAIAN